ncbi:MAG: tRNA (adenosine(37)-N6)-threonylcarbamoyltransferase complex ATPase subunit type 1 TsaE [Desulfomonilaceae bacterium]
MINRIMIDSASEQQTIAIGKALGAVLRPGDLVSLIGDLGSGKTRLAKGVISQALKVPIDEINSPSFTIVNRYEGPFTIDHADLYRVGHEAVEELGLMETVDANGALLIEWASGENPISDSELRVTFSGGEDEDSRLLEFEYMIPGAWSVRFTETFISALG